MKERYLELIKDYGKIWNYIFLAESLTIIGTARENKYATSVAEDLNKLDGVNVSESDIKLDLESALAVYKVAIENSIQVKETIEIAQSLLCHLRNVDLAIKVFSKAEEQCFSSRDFLDLSSGVLLIDSDGDTVSEFSDKLSNEDWAERLLSKAIELANTSDELLDISKFIHNSSFTNSKEWSLDILNSAESEALKGKGDTFTISGIMNIARHYCDDLADMKSAERCCEKAREKALSPEDFISISDSIMDFSEFDGKRDLAKILILQSLEYEISNPKREELAKKAEDESYLNDTKFAKEIRGFSNPIYDHIGNLPEDIQDKIRNEVVMTEWGPINKLNELVGSSYNDFDICNTDKVLTRQILEISEIFSRSLNDQGNLVENIQSVLNDNDWLTDLFKKQIKLAYNLRDIKQLSSSAMRIKNYLKNDVWAIKIFEDILSFCETSEDYWNYIHGVRGIFGDDAITIPGVSFINNVDTQLKHLEKIAITFSDFIKLGEYYKFPNVNKKELSKKFFKIASTKINLRMDLISMATYATIDFHLGDKVWGKELYETAYNNLSLSSHDIMTIANDVYKEDYLNDREWAKQMYLTAARKAVMSNEEWMLESVIDSVNDEYGFNDPDFAEEIRNTIKIKGSTID